MSEQHEMPSSWQWSTMSASCEKIQDGTHFSPDQDKQLSVGMYPYVTAKNVRPSGLDLMNLTYLEENEHRKIYERCDPKTGDVLLVKDGVNMGDAAINTIEGEISLLSSVCMLRPRKQVLAAEFLRYYILSPQGFRSLTGQMTGTAIKRVILRKIRETPVPIAPLNEQRRIASEIDELFSDLDAGVAALKRAKANLKRYRAAVLKAAVEGKLTEEWRAKNPAKESASALLARILKERRQKWESDQLAKFVTADKEPPKNWREKYVEPSPPDMTELSELPAGWCWASVEQICEVGTGTTPSRTNSSYYESGSIPWIMSGAVNLPFVDEGSEFVTDLALQETTLRLYPVGTLILALYGEGKTRGMVSELRIEATVNQALGALVFADPAVSMQPFVKVFLTSNYVQLRRQAAGGMQPNLNLGIVKQIAIPLPPIGEQVQIVAEVATRVSQIDAAEMQIEHGLLRASRLRQSILKQAFEGKLVPQDPKDEPASGLLERLRTSQSSHEGKAAEVRSGEQKRKR